MTEVHFRVLSGVEMLVPLLGIFTSVGAFVVSKLEVIRASLQVASLLIGCAVGLVTLGWTLWRWKRDREEKK